jgi:DNA polymerase-3 subunit alpha
MQDKFVEGAVRKGFPKEKATHVFELMAYFAGYGFNKSHSAAYALISYQTAYLKTHYPLELWAALLTNALDDTEKIGVFLAGAKDMGIEVLAPDINQSEFDFAILPGSRILFGLGAVKNVGKQAVDCILEARAQDGPFTDFPDFLKRIVGKKVNRRVIEALIRAGAFRSLGIRRAVAMESLDDLLAWAEKQKSGKGSMQKSLFSEDQGGRSFGPPLREVPEWDERMLLREEKNALGFYLTSHPMARYADLLLKLDTRSTRSLEAISEGETVRVFAVVSALREVKTKKGDKMAQLTLLDMEGTIEAVLFPDVYAQVQEKLQTDLPILVTGPLERNDFGSKIRVTRIETIEQALETLYQTVVVRLQTDGLSVKDLEDLKKILLGYPGPVPAILELKVMTRPYPVAVIGLHLNVSPSDELVQALSGRFGEQAVVRKEELDPDLRTYLVELKQRGGVRQERHGKEHPRETSLAG